MALTVVLLPPATAALFEAMHELAAGSAPSFRDFVASVRRWFVVAWLWAVWAGIGLWLVVLVVRFDPDPTQPGSWLAALFVVAGLLFAVSLLYVWPFLFLQSEGGLVRAIRNAVLTVLAAPLFGLVIALLLSVTVAVGVLLIFPLAVFVPGLMGLVASHAVSDRLRAFGKLPARPMAEDVR
jgi:hypothetical protein